LFRYLRAEIGRGGWRALSQLANPHSGLYADLIRAIRDKRQPLADGLSGRQAVELVLAIYRSALEKMPVALPLPDFPIQAMAGFFSHPDDPA
jgi:predicted dehydrogenase